MEELIENNKNFIRILQNPSKHVDESCKNNLAEHGVDFLNERQWIQFENKFNLDNFSGFEGPILQEMVMLLSIVNSQGGIASEYMEKIKLMSRNEVLRIYFKYLPFRQTTYLKNTYYIVSSWLYENSYMSELEFNRILSYKLDNKVETPSLAEFNRIIIQEEIFKYVKESRGQDI